MGEKKPKKLTAVIADDIQEMRELLEMTLNNFRIIVIGTASTGQEAIKLLKKHKVDLCFIDIKMPDTNGMGVLDIIKRDKIVTYPILISGESSANNVKKGLLKGAKGFIVKPYEPEKIEQILEKFNQEHPAGMHVGQIYF